MWENCGLRLKSMGEGSAVTAVAHEAKNYFDFEQVKQNVPMCQIAVRQLFTRHSRRRVREGKTYLGRDEIVNRKWEDGITEGAGYVLHDSALRNTPRAGNRRNFGNILVWFSLGKVVVVIGGGAITMTGGSRALSWTGRKMKPWKCFYISPYNTDYDRGASKPKPF